MAGISNFLNSEIIIIDGDGNAFKAKVDSTGRLLVSQQTISPPDTTEVVETHYSTVSGTSDEFYPIPNGETLNVTKLTGSAEVEQTAGSVIELFYAPNGDTTNLVVIAVIFASGSGDQQDLNESFVGDGTNAILLRRRRLSGGGKDVFGKWEGYY